MNRAELCRRLEALHDKFHKPQFIHPDPLETVLRFTEPRDQEIAGLIAATLAYGRAAQILVSIDRVLNAMDNAPYSFTRQASSEETTRAFETFQHRWTTGHDITNLILAMQSQLQQFDTLENSFHACVEPDDITTLPALTRWTAALTVGRPKNSVIANPASGSACKRLHLYLRWMVRKDAIDPGPWVQIDPALLVIPLDTHMFRFARKHRLTRRKTPDGRAAIEVTDKFRKMSPDDPLKYDFALTRLGIHPDLSPELLDLL